MNVSDGMKDDLAEMKASRKIKSSIQCS